MKTKYRITFVLIFLFFSLSVRANSVSITVSPSQPLVNEEFEVVFSVTSTSGSEEPYISFDPGGAEVRGRRLAGKQSNARFVNGKFSTSIVFTYSYQLITDRVGLLRLNNILVDLNGHKIKVPNKNIKVVSQRSTPKEFFLQAELSKTDVYIGEGIDVNYYLYSRVQNVGRTEIEIFPKLNSFIKRFYMPKNERQTVEYQGVVYRRSLEYSARVFPEKRGKQKIDPLRVKFQYTNYRNNGLRNFGLAFGRSKVKSLSSRPVYVNVSNIPAVNVPSDFTALVGEHDFKVSINKNKFLVNEAIEVKFEVSGPGALENYPAPVLYENDELEDFDSKSELVEINKSLGKKTFEYTYLARAPLSFKEKKITFSYFDSSLKVFKQKTLTLPSLIVGGGAIVTETSSAISSNNKEVVKEKTVAVQMHYSILAPVFSRVDSNLDWMWLTYLRNFLLFLILLLIIELIFKTRSFKKVPQDLLDMTLEIKKSGLSYSRLNKYLRLISTYRNDCDESSTLSEILSRITLTNECKKYFINNIEITENMEYNENSNNYNKNFIKKYFSELNNKIAKQ